MHHPEKRPVFCATLRGSTRNRYECQDGDPNPSCDRRRPVRSELPLNRFLQVVGELFARLTEQPVLNGPNNEATRWNGNQDGKDRSECVNGDLAGNRIADGASPGCSGRALLYSPFWKRGEAATLDPPGDSAAVRIVFGNEVDPDIKQSARLCAVHGFVVAPPNRVEGCRDYWQSYGQGSW
jgi:hypothetical protein